MCVCVCVCVYKCVFESVSSLQLWSGKERCKPPHPHSSPRTIPVFTGEQIHREEGPEEVEVGGFADLRLDSRKLARGGRSLTPLRVDPSMAFWSCRSQTKHMSNILSILGFDSFTVYLLFSNWQCPWQYLITKYINHLPIHVRHHMQ